MAKLPFKDNKYKFIIQFSNGCTALILPKFNQLKYFFPLL